MRIFLSILLVISVALAAKNEIDIPVIKLASKIGTIKTVKVTEENDSLHISGRVVLKRHRNEPVMLVKFISTDGMTLLEKRMSLHEEAKRSRSTTHSLGLARFYDDVRLFDNLGAIEVSLVSGN